MRKITRFFGVDSTNEDQARTTWVERRRRLAIKKLGGVKVLDRTILQKLTTKTNNQILAVNQGKDLFSRFYSKYQIYT